jgi:hypothetical protein
MRTVLVPSIWEFDPGLKSYVVLIDPEVPEPYDLDRPTDVDHAFWALWAAMRDRSVRRMIAVRRDMRGLLGSGTNDRVDAAQAELALMWALLHPQTAWGIGYRDRSGILWNAKGPEFNMSVLYRGEWFTRDRRGALTPVGVRVDWWPEVEDFADVIRQVRGEAS